jgi:hypothetical protein
VALLFICGSLTHVSRADVYTVKGTFVQSAVPTCIAVNDTFTLNFDYDTSGADVFPSVPFAAYLNAITNVVFSLNPASVGTYAGGMMTTVPNILLTDDFYGMDSFTMRPAAGVGSNFAPAEGKAFGSLWLQLDGTSVFTNVQSTGDVLSDILPVLDLSKFDLGARLTLEFGTDRSAAVANVTSITHASANQVPDTGATVTLLALGLLGMFAVTSRKDQQR